MTHRIEGWRVVVDRHGDPVPGTNGILYDQCWTLAERALGMDRQTLMSDSYGYEIKDVEMWTK